MTRYRVFGGYNILIVCFVTAQVSMVEVVKIYTAYMFSLVLTSLITPSYM